MAIYVYSGWLARGQLATSLHQHGSFFGAHTNMIPHLSEQGMVLQSLSGHQPSSLTVTAQCSVSNLMFLECHIDGMTEYMTVETGFLHSVLPLV